MNKIIKILCLVMIILCLTGCEKEEVTGDGATSAAMEEEITSAGKGVRYAEKYQLVSLSESGIIYDGKDGILRLVTIDEGEDIVLCYNQNCKHPKEKLSYGDSPCMASLYKGYCDTAYYEGAVYFFVNDGVFAHRVYKMDTNGAGRELLAKLPFLFTVTNSAVFCEDNVYYIAWIPKVDEITNDVRYTYRIVELSLADGSYRFITEESNNLISIINISGDTLYTRIADVDNGGCLNLVTIDINTLEEKVVIPAETWSNEYTYIDAYDENSYFYWDRQNYLIGIRNVDGTVEEILVRGAEGESFGWADPSCDGLYYAREYDYEDEPVGHYFLDLTTREVTNITDEQAKYNIVGYDGYYDAFVSRDKDFNWSMWSKEKILSEAEAGS